MSKLAYISFSDMAWNTSNPEVRQFENMKTGATYISNGHNVEILNGIPSDARLQSVIFVYESDTVEDTTDNPLNRPGSTIHAKITPTHTQYRCPLCNQVLPPGTEQCMHVHNV